jgi:pimeloyl-ACP methyl ester carboxylesterase
MTVPADRAVVSAARVSFAQEAVDQMRRKLAATRAVRFPFAEQWQFGTGMDVVAMLLERWAEFDVEALAARLNAVPQVDVNLQGVRVRAFHFRGEHEHALPVVLTHGWPSTVLELLSVADRLARPSGYDGPRSDCFHVVVPALPGFPLSDAPGTLDEYTAARTADRWAELMAALGYRRFAASAGDIGARVTAWLGARHHERVLGIHVSSNALSMPAPDANLSATESAWLRRRAEWDQREAGYVHVQNTKPLSLAHGLADSPAGLAAWIIEKWHGWSEVTGNVIEHFGAQEILGTLSLYWLTNSIATSFIPYYVYDHAPGAHPAPGAVRVPTSFYLAPAENGGIPPRELAERQYPVARWTELPRGGHFLATEEPDLLAQDIRDAFRTARGHSTT